VMGSSAFGKVVRVWLIGGLTGLATGLLFTLAVDIFSTDNMFDLWEFGVSLATPALAGIVVALATRSGKKTSVAVAYLTFLAPIFGASFGASGSEPLWQFGALGLAGGLVWSFPFAVCPLARKRHS
jgi:hypothetical protein